MSGLSTVGLADYFASWASPLLGLHATSLTAIRRASAPGVGGATALFTTSTAPTSAKRSSLRRVKPSVRRRSPKLLCRHRYAATVSTNLSMKRKRRSCVGRVEVRPGWRRRVSGLWGLCCSWCWFIFLSLKMAACSCTAFSSRG